MVSAACSTVVMRTLPIGLVAHGAQRRDLAFNLIEAGSDAVEQALARFGEGHATRRTGQQPQAQARFERADRVAQRRLGYAQLAPPPW